MRKNNQALSAGLTERNHELYLTLVNGRAHSVEALGRIAIPVRDGSPGAIPALGAVAINALFTNNSSLLSKDVQWTTFYDQAGFVSASVTGVRDAIVSGV